MSILFSVSDQGLKTLSFGLKNALELGIVKSGSTIIAVQGWRQGSFHTNTMRILTVPVDAADLAIVPLTA